MSDNLQARKPYAVGDVIHVGGVPHRVIEVFELWPESPDIAGPLCGGIAVEPMQHGPGG